MYSVGTFAEIPIILIELWTKINFRLDVRYPVYFFEYADCKHGFSCKLSLACIISSYSSDHQYRYTLYSTYTKGEVKGGSGYVCIFELNFSQQFFRWNFDINLQKYHNYFYSYFRNKKCNNTVENKWTTV